ncbi:MAG: D-glycerate dehydrogenase [bacterium]|nr:D-glycerate dehydrogenase [bacterium]
MARQKLTVFITRPIPKNGIDLIKQYAKVVLRDKDSIITRAELLAGIKNADIIVPILTDKIDAKVLDAAPKLKLIANYGAGYNNIDIPAATERGIMVTNTPGVLTDTTGELAVGLMLAIARRIPETEHIMRAGKYPGWGPLMYLGHEVSGKTLGIIGLGRIGNRVAEIANHGFGMNILYHTQKKERDVERSLGAKKVTLATLLKQSDFVTMHVPLTEETHHMIGKKELKMMKSDAFLINTSRGPVVNEKSLVEALKKNEIAGAALDVYENEPKMAPGLSKLKNALLVPHIGSATIEARSAMAKLAAKNVVAFINKKPLPTLVNREVLIK